MWTICRMDALAAGAALAILLRTASGPAVLERRWRWVTAGTALLALVTFVVTRGLPRASVPTQTLGYSMLTVVFTYVLFAAVRAEVRGRQGGLRPALARVLGVAPLRSVGKVSYGMYVFHLPLHAFLSARVLARWGPGGLGVGGAVFYAVAATLLTYGAAMLSYHLFEKRFLALKHRFTIARAPAPGPA